MKKYIFGLLIICTSTTIFAQKLSVLDYFDKLPDSVRMSYKISNSKGKWVSTSIAEYEINPIVDLRNGYIELIDEGTGGGVSKLQVVLYRKKDASALIGVSSYIGDGVWIEHSLVFLEYKNQQWIDVSSEVLPNLSYKDFVKETYEMPDFPESYYEISTIYYKLPQHGTSIKASLDLGGLFLICDGTMNALPANKNLVCDFIANIKETPLALFWDKKNKRFYQK